MTLIGFITQRGSIQRILEHLDEPTRPPPIASARGPPHEDFDRYELDAFASSDPLPLYEFDQPLAVLTGGDDRQGAPALRTLLDVDIEHPA